MNVTAEKTSNLQLKGSFSGPLSVRDVTASGTGLLMDDGTDLSEAVSGRI